MARKCLRRIVSGQQARGCILGDTVAQGGFDPSPNERKGLANVLALRSAGEILDVALSYFPADRFPLRARLLIEELFP